MIQSTFLAIIPARGGSKGIKLKNLYPVLSKPLLQWTFDEVLKSKYLSKVLVSSDHEGILNFSKSSGVETLKRVPELSKDDSTTIDVVLNIVENEMFRKYDYLVILQPTSPLRSVESIDSAIEQIVKQGAAALISVTVAPSEVLKYFILGKDGKLDGIRNNLFPFVSRQSLPRVYKPNGAIYIIKTETLIKLKSLFVENETIPFVMDNFESVDIDSLSDITKVEDLLKRKLLL